MKAAALLSLFLLCGCGLAKPNFACRQNAYARASHVNAGPGFLGSLLVSTIDRPPPHPPLDEMLAQCNSEK